MYVGTAAKSAKGDIGVSEGWSSNPATTIITLTLTLTLNLNLNHNFMFYPRRPLSYD